MAGSDKDFTTAFTFFDIHPEYHKLPRDKKKFRQRLAKRVGGNESKKYVTKRSLINFGTRVVALAPGKGKEAVAGKGTFAQVKRALDKDSHHYVVKIERKEQLKQLQEIKRKGISHEAKIADDLGLLIAETTRGGEPSDFDSPYAADMPEQRYYLYPDLGMDLAHFLLAYELSDSLRTNLSIELCWQLQALQEGYAAISGRKYLHRDVKLGNCAYHLKKAELSLIDFGVASELPDEPSQVRRGTPFYLPATGHDFTAKQDEMFALYRTLYFPEKSSSAFKENYHRVKDDAFEMLLSDDIVYRLHLERYMSFNQPTLFHLSRSPGFLAATIALGATSCFKMQEKLQGDALLQQAVMALYYAGQLDDIATSDEALAAYFTNERKAALAELAPIICEIPQSILALALKDDHSLDSLRQIALSSPEERFIIPRVLQFIVEHSRCFVTRDWQDYLFDKLQLALLSELCKRHQLSVSSWSRVLVSLEALQPFYELGAVPIADLIAVVESPVANQVMHHLKSRGRLLQKDLMCLCANSELFRYLHQQLKVPIADLASLTKLPVLDLLVSLRDAKKLNSKSYHFVSSNVHLLRQLLEKTEKPLLELLSLLTFPIFIPFVKCLLAMDSLDDKAWLLLDGERQVLSRNHAHAEDAAFCHHVSQFLLDYVIQQLDVLISSGDKKKLQQALANTSLRHEACSNFDVMLQIRAVFSHKEMLQQFSREELVSAIHQQASQVRTYKHHMLPFLHATPLLKRIQEMKQCDRSLLASLKKHCREHPRPANPEELFYHQVYSLLSEHPLPRLKIAEPVAMFRPVLSV